jgi:hypothetical protein
MRKLRTIFRLIRRAWKRRSGPLPETRLISSIDPKEFSDLLAGRRNQDLKTLADKLGQHARASQGRVPAKPLPSSRSASRSKGSGMPK